MKFISINGSSCSGKSAVIKNVLKQRDRLFYLSYDAIKWSFSNYSPNDHFKDVHTLMRAMAESIFNMQYDVISESGLYKEWRETLFAAARARGYEVVEIVLEADYDVLEKRFDERVAAKLANPELRISNVSKERFKELYEIFQKEKSSSALVFRSDAQSPEEIAANVTKLF